MLTSTPGDVEIKCVNVKLTSEVDSFSKRPFGLLKYFANMFNLSLLDLKLRSTAEDVKMGYIQFVTDNL